MNRIQAFGQTYRSIKSLARDPRCIVNYYTLWRRIRFYGWEITEAASIPENESWYIVWNEKFATLEQVQADPRCVVKSRSTLRKRMKQGIPIQDAVLKQPAAQLKFEIWDQQFTNLMDISRDSRCYPQYKTLIYRLRLGTPLEIAVQEKEVFLTWRREVRQNA